MSAEGGAAAAASADSDADVATTAAAALEFGWVPAEVVRCLLEEVGNFRVRAGAIELLHAAVLDVDDGGALLPTLSAFLAFLLRLVVDANFKIAISAMTILEDVVTRLGADAQPYLGTVMAPLIERLGDNVQMVRQAAARAMAVLARVLGPQPVLTALGGALVHPEWRVREEGINAHTAALLSHPKDRFDYPVCVRALTAAATDDTPRVAVAALEAFALLHARLGALLQGLLTAVGAPEAVKRQVAERIREAHHLGLPVLDAQGAVQHQAHARPPSAQRIKPAAAAAALKPALASAPLQLAGTSALPVASSMAAGPQAVYATVAAPNIVGSGALPLAGSGTASLGIAASAAGGIGTGGPTLALQGSTLQYPSPFLASGYSSAAIPAFSAGSYAGSAYSYTHGAAAAGVEPSASSCASSAGMGYVGSGSGSYASGSNGGIDAVAPAAADGGQEVQRSEGSLLTWVRPGRRPTQQPSTAAPGARPAVYNDGSGSVLGSAGSAPPLLSAVAHGSGRSRAAAPVGAAGGDQQQSVRGSGIRNFLRSAKSTPASMALTKPGEALALPAVAARLLPKPPAAQGGHPPAGPAAASGAYNVDLYSSVSNWQQQRGGSYGSMGDADAAGPYEAAHAALALQAAGGLHSQHGGQDAGMAVEARSDSLLQWRLPARAASSRQAAAGLQQQARQPASSAATAQPMPARMGSAAFKRTLSTFKKKLFGGEAAAIGREEQPPGQPDSPSWAIAAARGQADQAAAAHSQQHQHQQYVQPQVAAERLPADNTGLRVFVPEPAALGLAQQQQPDSPGKSPDRMSKLKQLSDRRRVWSAPIAAQHQLAQLPPDGDQQQGAALLLNSRGAEGSPQRESAAAATADCVPAAGAGGLEGSPGPRPGLQALKARARTARLQSGSGGSGGGLPPGGSGLYSMEAVDDMFGPDQPVGGSVAAAWSPVKAAGVSIPSSPPKLSVLTRAGTGSGNMHWPDSPSPGGAGGGSSGTASSRASSWRGASFLDSASSSPKAAGAAAAASASGGASFSPTAADTSPLPHPEAALQAALAALHAAAASQKKELDWQAQYEALRTTRRLARHHCDVLVPPALHALVAAAAPLIDALRSTTSRLAISVFQELVEAMGPAVGAELDNFVPLLLKRAGQVSIAGRDNFLAVEADRALAAVVSNAGEARAAAALLNCLASCKSPDMRAKAAMHLDVCLQQHGPRLVAATGGQAPLVTRLLRAAVGLLEEGGLDGRTAGKRMLWELRRLLDGGAGGGGDDFRRALARLDCKTDKVWDVFESGRMPAPPARIQSASLRCTTAAGSGPSSPTICSSIPPKQGMLGTTISPLVPVSRGSCSGSASGSIGSRASSIAPAAVAGPGLGSSSGFGAAPPSKRQPSAQPSSRPGGTSAAGSGSAAGSTAAGRRGSRPASGRPGLAVDSGSGAGPTASIACLDPELQQRLEAGQAQLGSREWKERLEGLEAVQQAMAAAAAAAPPAIEVHLWLAEVLTQRVLDVNLKVQQQALAALNSVLEGAGEGLAAAAPNLVPAVCKCLDSGNPSVRQAGADALDVVVRDWNAAAYLPPLMAVVGAPAGAARGKAVLLDRLVSFGPVLWLTRPALVHKHVLPALFALLTAERRPELRQMVQGALAVLAKSMGADLAVAAAAVGGLAPAQQQLVADIVAAQSGSRAPR